MLLLPCCCPTLSFGWSYFILLWRRHIRDVIQVPVSQAFLLRKSSLSTCSWAVDCFLFGTYDFLSLGKTRYSVDSGICHLCVHCRFDTDTPEHNCWWMHDCLSCCSSKGICLSCRITTCLYSNLKKTMQRLSKRWL